MLRHINWSDPKSYITDHFTVKEALWLPSWGVLHKASEAERAELLKTCVLLERIRDYVGGRAVNVHCMIRPNKVNSDRPDPAKIVWSTEPVTREKQVLAFSRLDYNAFIGSVAKRSPHILGMACDFSIVGLSCDQVRNMLLPLLEPWGFCMEDIPGAGWVHVDTYAPSVHGGRRFFKP